MFILFYCLNKKLLVLGVKEKWTTFPCRSLLKQTIHLPKEGLTKAINPNALKKLNFWNTINFSYIIKDIRSVFFESYVFKEIWVILCDIEGVNIPVVLVHQSTKSFALKRINTLIHTFYHRGYHRKIRVIESELIEIIVLYELLIYFLFQVFWLVVLFFVPGELIPEVVHVFFYFLD